MPLFRFEGKKAHRIQPREGRIKEDEIHRQIEENLDTFFDGLVFVAHKPRIGGKEFDTLALDVATKMPVILEYKREKDRGVIEQVDLYYVKLRHNKSDVMILFQKQAVTEDLGDIDFDHPQIVVVANEFTPEQREILTLKRAYLRLFRYQLYAERIITLEEVEPLGTPSDIVRTARGGRRSLQSAWDIDHFGMKAQIRELYDELDKMIVSLDSRVKPGKVNKYFIGYGATGPYFCALHPRVNSIWVVIKSSRTPLGARGIKLYRIPGKRHTTMTHEFQISSQKQLGSAVRLIKAALEDSL